MRSRWLGYGFLVAVILGVLTAIFAFADIGGWGCFLFGSIVSVIIVWCFAPLMPQRTATGAQEQRKWEAFRNYLHDLTRFQDMESAKENFEKYLPYAIAFGVETAVGAAVRRPERSLARLVSPADLPPDPHGRRPCRHRCGCRHGRPGGRASAEAFRVFPAAASAWTPSPTVCSAVLGNMSSVLTSAPSSSGSGHGAFGGGGFGGGGFGGGFSAEAAAEAASAAG